ncbi:MAG: hypothetical protein WAT76_11505, partial [Dokdonella sp.]|uniref:hypothetical protein n=1 Tax=Dokdonella sp. TaxID=2291710 RepID=UPI003BB05FED
KIISIAFAGICLVGRENPPQQQCSAGFLCPWMDGMPTTQEQLSAFAMDGRYADNAGAVAGICHGWTVHRQRRATAWMQEVRIHGWMR